MKILYANKLCICICSPNTLHSITDREEHEKYATISRAPGLIKGDLRFIFSVV